MEHALGGVSEDILKLPYTVTSGIGVELHAMTSTQAEWILNCGETDDARY